MPTTMAMSVEIKPAELGFRQPFTEEVGETLWITNNTTSPVAFKVKTTAPKQYCVRPNSGRIEPETAVGVTVLLQAMKTNPPPDAKCRDKFLVQTVPIAGDKEFTNVQQIWESVDKSAVVEKKIRVNWLPPLGGDHPPLPVATPVRKLLPNGVEAAPTPEVPQQAFSSPSTETTTTDKSTTYHAAESKIEPKPRREAEPEAKREVAVPPTTPPATPRTAVESVKATTVSAYNELKGQLAKAEAKVVNTAAAATAATESTSGLRQRNTNPAAPRPVEKGAVPPVADLAQALKPHTEGTEGIPVQIAAVLCLISFLLGYFFF